MCRNTLDSTRTSCLTPLWHRSPQVQKYWPEKGKSGFLVWRYLLKRDDDEPAPWTRDGKERVKKLGLTIQVDTTTTLLLSGHFTH